MKNLFLLTTEKPSRLLINKEGTLVLTSNFYSSSNPQNIYITNSEEIRKGDWCYHPLLKGGSIIQSKFDNPNSTMKKIILTTDQDLIKDGVQAIDDEFLEWFVKNPSCEEVEVVSAKTIPALQLTGNGHCWWKIIIPKEESKQECRITKIMQMDAKMAYDSLPKQETLEEASDNAWLNYEHVEGNLYSTSFKNGFKLGAKWQQEQYKNKYSEEEVPNNLDSVLAKITHQNDLGLSQWHEVVYYDNYTDKWCCYSGSKTFQDGERVIAWKYCKDLI
jgi:hypothetical protein